MASTTGWTALGGGASGLVAPETDFFIQGSNCISKAGWSTAIKGIIYNMGSGQTVSSGKAVYMWIYYWAPNSLDVEAGSPGGMQLLIGSATTAYKAWDIRGKDTLTYGGWVCGVVDPTTTADDTTGSPSATLQYFGATANVPAAGPSKGQPLGIDAFRHGRDFTCTNGEAGNYATFAGAATFNDYNDGTNGYRRYGQFQAIDGGYLMQCRFLMGSSGTAVDFRDSNKNILVANTKKVAATFNTFEIQNATSRVDWTNISIKSLGTVSKGTLVVTDNADVNFDGCVFTDMNTFTFLANSTINTSTFRRCGLITQASAVFNGCTFDSSTSSATILANNPANISNCSFTSDGSNHALEITTAGTYAFASNSFFSYASADGSTGNEVIYNNSGGSVTLNVTGSGAGTISVRNGAGASTTVASSASLVINIVDSEGAALTQNCEVTIVKNSDTTILFEEDNITDGTTTYSYSSGGGTVTYVNVLNVAGYQPKTVNNVTLPSSGTTTLTIQLDTDPFYTNP